MQNAMFVKTIKRMLLPLLALGTLAAHIQAAEDNPVAPDYFDISGHADAWSGGAQMIPTHTPRAFSMCG